MATESLLGFIATSLIIELTPGPNMTTLALLTLTHGRRAGFAAVAGVAAGLLAIGVAAALGVAAVVVESPAIYELLRWCGVAYLLFLAWISWYEQTASTATAPTALHTDSRFFRRGLTINLLNPKAAAFYITVLPEFIEAGGNALHESMLFTCIYVLIATLIHLAIVLLASHVSPFLEKGSQRIFIKRTMALLLAAVALWFAGSTAH